MKKLFKLSACVSSSIAAVMMLLGFILVIFHSHFLGFRPWVWYYSSINFILFAILFHLAGAEPEPEKKA